VTAAVTPLVRVTPDGEVVVLPPGTPPPPPVEHGHRPPRRPATTTTTTMPATTSTTAAARRATPAAPRSPVHSPRAAPARPAADGAAPSPPPTPREHHVVVPGDNLWRIAATRLAAALGREPSDAEIAPYWQRVIAANRTTLRSGDPDLVFPGELVALPPPPRLT
jgi:nucleoid-associated protein YgaU